MSPDKMNRIAELANEFVVDVLPQTGRLALQNYGHLNELCLLLNDWRKEQERTDGKS